MPIKANDKLTIKKLLNTKFSDLYKELFQQKELDKNKYIKLLSIAIILNNQTDKNLKKLAYRIALIYGIKTDDLIPIYDMAINTGLMPLAYLAKSIIEKRASITTSEFVNEIANSQISAFEVGDIIQTEQQFVLGNIFEKNLDKSFCAIAPTSYGKSELIINSLKKNTSQKTCIIVPSKALLAQTKKRILDAKISSIKKIITHPEMHDKDQDSKNFVYLLTQERLLRIINEDESLSFDLLFIDESHNLLENDSRNQLLGTTISILSHRNTNIAIKYLTPFINDPKNINIKTAKKVDKSFSIDEYIKSEVYYLVDFRDDEKKQLIYDQFIDDFIERKNIKSDYISYIKRNSVGKNIIYFNKPKDIEKFSMEFIKKLDDIESTEISNAIIELESGFDKDYRLIKCLKKGVLYHHGSMTDTVRHYVEHLFRTSNKIKYLICSSTLLEGVNTPVEKMFLMSCEKGRKDLSPSQFRNLTGRVNRFNEIFSGVNDKLIEKLIPKIHLIATTEYSHTRRNLKNFIKKTSYVFKEIKDEPKNVLLENTQITEKNRHDYENALFRLENIENGIIDNYQGSYVSTEVGKLLLANGVSEIDILNREEEIDEIINEIPPHSISTPEELITLVCDTFIALSEDSDEQLSRLKNEQAQHFYTMIFDWKINKQSFKYMISKFMRYWNKLVEDDPEVLVYVGKWGDHIKENGFKENYTMIGKKPRSEKVNLAIVRIKEEEDFIENILFKFIDILGDLQLIEDNFYKKIKYGTTNADEIVLIRNGLSRSTAEHLLENYREYLKIDPEKNTVTFRKNLSEAMEDNYESLLQIFEVKMNTSS